MAYDIQIISKDADDKISYGFRNMGKRAAGGNKLLQQFLKNLMNDSSGGLIKAMRSRNPNMEVEISNAVIKASDAVMKLQAGNGSLHPDEIFVSAKLKNLDIREKGTVIDMYLEIKSKTGTLHVHL